MNEDFHLNKFILEIKNSKTKEEQNTVLHLAAQNGHLKLCKILIDEYDISKYYKIRLIPVVITDFHDT